MIDLSPTMERTFSKVGNVSGRISENSAINISVRIGKPNTGNRRTKRANGERPASSRRVGSSALDLSDCMEYLRQ